MILNITDNKILRNLSFTESEIYVKELELNISLPYDFTKDYVNDYEVFDILWFNNKLHMLVYRASTYSLRLHIYDNNEWQIVEIETATSAKAISNGNMQEFNGDIYIAYARNSQHCRLVKYKDSVFTEIKKENMSTTCYVYLVKDYDNNKLYWVRNSYNSSETSYSYYYSYDGVTVGSPILWSYAKGVELQGAYVKNNKLYIAYSKYTGSTYEYYIDEFNLTETDDNLRYCRFNIYGSKDTRTFGLTKRINNEYLSLNAYTVHRFLCQNNGNLNMICPAIAFTEADDGIILYWMNQRVNNENTYKALTKVKLYKILRGYAYKNDVIQCGESFSISDNLESIDDYSYKVTEDGYVQIGVYI